MAYDPEARETSNSAMIISVVVLVLAVGAALLYFTRPRDTTDVAVVPSAPTQVVERETVREVPVPAPASGAPTTVVVPAPKTVVVPGASSRTEVRSSTNRTETRVVAPPAGSSGNGGSGSSGSSAPPARVDVNTNVNVQPPAGSSSGSSGATDAGSTGGTDAGTGSSTNATGSGTTGSGSGSGY